MTVEKDGVVVGCIVVGRCVKGHGDKKEEPEKVLEDMTEEELVERLTNVLTLLLPDPIVTNRFDHIPPFLNELRRRAMKGHARLAIVEFAKKYAGIVFEDRKNA